MKRCLTYCCVLLLSAGSLAADRRDSLLNVLDATVADFQVYVSRKEHVIDSLKLQLAGSDKDSRGYEICAKIFDEYRSFQSDSALVFARRKLLFAEGLEDQFRLTEARLNLASVLGMVGMYKESVDMLSSVDIEQYPDLKAYYYHIKRTVYGFMADYAVSTQEQALYRREVKAYIDSLLLTNPSNTASYVMSNSDRLIAEGRADEALAELFAYYKTIPNDENQQHTQAMVAYCISMAYQNVGNRAEQELWLILSAINDIQSANKEYVSLRNLAYLLYEEGDVDRSYRYIRRALDDALFCNARLRTYEISQMLPIIDRAYQHQTEERQRLMKILLISVSLLSLSLLVAMLFVYRQMRKVAAARRALSEANSRLNSLNQELSETNSLLQQSNSTLLEANLIKEEYIGRYMDQCSAYIDKLDIYRRQLNRSATAGKIDELLQAVKSKQFIDDELREFYTNFDSTFLHLFPTFVEEFNALLTDDEDTRPKAGELLNTELRIYALIRLGITDSVKIAHFLRYSLSTIYNYRTKLRNKSAVARDEFEARVMRIGSEK